MCLQLVIAALEIIYDGDHREDQGDRVRDGSDSKKQGHRFVRPFSSAWARIAT